MDSKNIEKLKIISRHYFGDPEDKDIPEVEVELDPDEEEDKLELPIEYEEQ